MSNITRPTELLDKPCDFRINLMPIEHENELSNYDDSVSSRRSQKKEIEPPTFRREESYAAQSSQNTPRVLEEPVVTEEAEKIVFDMTEPDQIPEARQSIFSMNKTLYDE